MPQTIEISNSEFRAHQGLYIDKVFNEGMNVIVRRRDKRTFAITPVEKKLSPELIAVIERGLKNMRAGKGTPISSREVEQMWRSM